MNEIEKDVIIQGFRSCIQSNCDGLKSTIISNIGQYILIETYSTSGDGEQYAVQFKHIPKKIKFSFMMDEYKLAGLINFKSPAKQTRHSTDIQDIGHYTAISYRRGKWIKYDDCKDAEQILNDNYISSPHIILYIAQ
ncbi:uncharacterized protein LOC120359203 [Solenopsis invicta]|uniref:uncharacterized protein LOC120359203 n=1 Tax=Solenopsis invicta TaxID=13686 RepID=UPI00193C9206|nr:uncharacterized protein LOC120359203 [Solenopsis invicta]